MFKSYINKTCVAVILDFRFCAVPAKYLQGFPPRLCLWVYVEMISTDQPVTARHIPPSASLGISPKICHFLRLWQPSWICP